MNFFDVPVGEGALRQTHLQMHQRNIASHANDEKSVNNKSKQKVESKSRSIGSQTIYREQSAQTKPYLPEINYYPGIEESELFQTADLFEQNTGTCDTERINRLRKQQQWKNALRQCNDADVFVATSKETNAIEQKLICEAIEYEEWLAREQDFDLTQAMRLQTVKNMLNKRDKLIKKDSAKIFNRTLDRLVDEHERNVNKIQ